MRVGGGALDAPQICANLFRAVGAPAPTQLLEILLTYP